jgi:hypothetical protein
MKRLANLKINLPSKSKLNKFQSLNLKGGGDKRKRMNRGDDPSGEGTTGG